MKFVLQETPSIYPIFTPLVKKRFLPHIVFYIRKEFLPSLIREAGKHHPTQFEVYQINIPWGLVAISK